MKKYIYCILCLIFSISLNATAVNAPATPLEASQHQVLPNSNEISEYLHTLVDKSSLASISVLGKSAGGRNIEAVLISTHPAFLKNGQPIKNKPTVMLIGSQHGNEASGTEALQMVVRDLLIGKQKHLLKDMNLVIIVCANPDGRDNRSRFNEDDGDVNLDYVKLAQSETLVFVDAWIKYQPHVILDLHEAPVYKKVLTKQQGYMNPFESQFEVSNNQNIPEEIRNFETQVFLPAVIEKNISMGVPARQYTGEILNLQQSISGGGLRLWNFRNYSSIRGSISVLVENRLDRRKGEYTTPHNIQERARKQKISVEAFLTTVQLYKNTILSITETVRSNPSEQTIFLRHQRVIDEKKPTADIDLIHVETGKYKTFTFPSYGKIVSSIPLETPLAYVITDEQQKFKALLKKHRLRYQVINNAATIPVVQPFIRKVEVITKAHGYTNILNVSTDENITELEVQPGDLWVPVDQPFGKFIPILLDPRSTDSIFQEQAYRPLLLKDKSFFISRVLQPD
jgi:hypothetical protein